MGAISVSEQQFKEIVQKDELVLVDFWAPWCGDCRRIARAYDQIADECAGKMTVIKVNVEENLGVRERETVKRIPTLRLYRNGVPQGEIMEPPGKADIEAFLEGIMPVKVYESDTTVHDMLVIGGGPGGYTTALYASRAGIDTIVLERLSAGGQMSLTKKIDNYPGFPSGIIGTELGEQMQSQAEQFGAKTINATVLKIDLQGSPKCVDSTAGKFYAKTIVLAMGADPRRLGLPNERELVNAGVAYCAACDGMFYKDKVVAVVGGGNSAAADALLLSRIAEKVILIHRRDSFRATRIYHEPLLHSRNIEVCWNSAVKEILHGDMVTGVRIQDVKTGEETDIPCDGVFISIGREPNTELVKGQIDLENGYIVADETTATSIPGVHAVGDIRAKKVRQVVTAVADGANAVHMAEEYLANH